MTRRDADDGDRRLHGRSIFSYGIEPNDLARASPNRHSRNLDPRRAGNVTINRTTLCGKHYRRRQTAVDSRIRDPAFVLLGQPLRGKSQPRPRHTGHPRSAQLHAVRHTGRIPAHTLDRSCGTSLRTLRTAQSYAECQGAKIVTLSHESRRQSCVAAIAAEYPLDAYSARSADLSALVGRLQPTAGS
jgi:hypothetical protein